eukprot:15262901-Alexandrium_andersonii.AAC.1
MARKLILQLTGDTHSSSIVNEMKDTCDALQQCYLKLNSMTVSPSTEQAVMDLINEADLALKALVPLYKRGTSIVAGLQKSKKRRTSSG